MFTVAFVVAELPAASVAMAVASERSVCRRLTSLRPALDRCTRTVAVWPPPRRNAPAPSLLVWAPRSVRARARRPLHERSVFGHVTLIATVPVRLSFTERGVIATFGAVVSWG